nr:MAG TPA: hypothetical protein [Caudoviricetes sp.]DAZ12209.1 MAG TPA: hypothetical protein [Caudoviricetes sp.]
MRLILVVHFNHLPFWPLMNFIHLIIAKMSCIHHQRLKT